LRKRGIELADLIVVVDDVDLDLGRLRIRARKSGRAQRPEVVEAALGSDAYARCVWRGPTNIGRRNGEPRLSRFAPDEKEARNSDRAAADAVEMLVKDGLVKAMIILTGEVSGGQMNKYEAMVIFPDR